MRCPTGCDAPLVMTERSGIEIDYCPTCRGVWLDRGELDKIIERNAAASNYPTRVPEYVTPASLPVGPIRHQPPASPRKKKRGFLEDLFEF